MQGGTLDAGSGTITNVSALDVTTATVGSVSGLSGKPVLLGDVDLASHNLYLNQFGAGGTLDLNSGTLANANVNATDLTSGTVADARLSANVPLLNVANGFTSTLSATGLTTSNYGVHAMGQPGGVGGTGVLLGTWEGSGSWAYLCHEFYYHQADGGFLFDPSGNTYARPTQFFIFQDGGNSYATLLRLNTGGNVGIGTNDQFGSAVGTAIGIKNVTTAPSTTPTGGGVLYSDGGALKWKGSSGTVTTLAPA